jgi:hypothetical protein
MIHEGAAAKELPTDVVFDGGRFDGRGSGAYGISIGDSLRSGFRNVTVCPVHLHQFYVGAGAVQPVDVNNTFLTAC